MSRKNNKSIKKRYNEFLKQVQRKQQKKKQNRERAKEDRQAIENAEQMFDMMGIDQNKNNRMDIQKTKKIKKKAKIHKNQHKKKRKLK